MTADRETFSAGSVPREWVRAKFVCPRCKAERGEFCRGVRGPRRANHIQRVETAVRWRRYGADAPKVKTLSPDRLGGREYGLWHASLAQQGDKGVGSQQVKTEAKTSGGRRRLPMDLRRAYQISDPDARRHAVDTVLAKRAAERKRKADTTS